MCYVHNQWYDISCATLYLLTYKFYEHKQHTLILFTKHKSVYLLSENSYMLSKLRNTEVQSHHT